jgi:hypothetical protein
MDSRLRIIWDKFTGAVGVQVFAFSPKKSDFGVVLRGLLESGRTIKRDLNEPTTEYNKRASQPKAQPLSFPRWIWIRFPLSYLQLPTDSIHGPTGIRPSLQPFHLEPSP